MWSTEVKWITHTFILALCFLSTMLQNRQFCNITNVCIEWMHRLSKQEMLNYCTFLVSWPSKVLSAADHVQTLMTNTQGGDTHTFTWPSEVIFWQVKRLCPRTRQHVGRDWNLPIGGRAIFRNSPPRCCPVEQQHRGASWSGRVSPAGWKCLASCPPASRR